ncbi:hypothetical protein KUV28_08420 [Ferrimonas balearica]|nr:hypothetical protein [Ferrimonas balearica]
MSGRQREMRQSADGNLRTGLARRRRAADPMAEFDQLPPVLRGWLAEAALPWSARSVRRVYTRALAENGGDEAAALARLSAVEQQRLTRDGIAPG